MKNRLYRHFDKEGDLLYVGISIDPVARLVNHTSKSKWKDEIATITIERFESQHDAMNAEYRAIVDEKPRHNRAIPMSNKDRDFVRNYWRERGVFC